MSVTGNNLFMLEVIVYRVTLTDQVQIHNTCPVCVCFRFPGLVELVICEGGFCADGKVGGGEILMTNGKSCLLTVSTADLCRTARDFCAIISVNRRVVGEQQMRYVAQTKLEFDRTFVDVILNPSQDQRARKLKRVLPLYDSGRPNPVGTIEVFVRLTSQGDLVVTHFNRAPDSDKYQYKAINEYVPTNASAMNCTERIMLSPKKTCKHKTSCKNKRPMVKQDPDSNCVSEMKQANCVMTMMEKLTALYKEMKTNSQAQIGEVDTDVDQQGKPCMFDLNCPATRCPFRTGKPANAFVSHLIDGTRPGVWSSNNRLKNREIVDDADLFVVNVGRVDPCRVIAPLVYKDGCSQCFETDFSTILLPPPPPPVEKKKKKGKKSKKSKKSKKGKKAKA